MLKQFGHVTLHEFLAKHTTFKIGGQADYFVTAKSTDDLIELLKYLDQEGTPYFILGGGSNVLVRDDGFDGVVVKVRSQKSEVRSPFLEADAGCVTVEMAQQSIKAELTGFEWGVGVPGTIGGAVRGNAGAMDGEMKDVVESVDVYQDGEVVTLSNTACEFRYRDSVFKHGGGVVLRARLRLRIKEKKDEAGIKKALEYLQYRSKTQPQGWANTGCIFKNSHQLSAISHQIEMPKEFIQKGKIPAGWLVEKAGMKGAQVGNAKVSDVHGNFIVNMGGATAADVSALIEKVKGAVYTRCGVVLEEEIQILGN